MFVRQSVTGVVTDGCEKGMLKKGGQAPIARMARRGLRTIGAWPPFFNVAARKYNPKKLYEIIGILREYDMKSKGFGNISTPSAELQKELVYKLLH